MDEVKDEGGSSTPEFQMEIGQFVDQSYSRASRKSHVLEWNVEEYAVHINKKQTRTILRNIVGRAESGTFTAIMGPSGSGKTSLLDCLALRNQTFSGALRLDQEALTGEYFTMTGYVYQNELFFPHLTVREHLTFHAINRIGCPQEEIDLRVQMVARELDLEKILESRIGGGTFYVSKGLSGGERKRLSIATELLADPSIILLDEPTSGLDAVMADLICLLLKSLAERPPQRIVMASLHTPSSRNFLLFTHVLLLTSLGELAFMGPARDLLPYLEGLGYACPPHFNPADFALELASAKVILGHNSAETGGGEGLTPPGLVSKETSGSACLVKSHVANELIEAFNKYCREEFSGLEGLKDDPNRRQIRGVKGVKSSTMTLLKANLWRAWLQQNRERAGLAVEIGMNVALGLIFGVLYYGQMPHDDGRNTAGFLFTISVTLIIATTALICMSFPSDFSILMREYFSGANTIVAYFIGRTFSVVPHSLVFMLMGIIPYWLTGMAPDVTAFGNFCVIFFLLIFGSQSIGYFTSSFSSNPVVGLTITPLIISPMILFSGFLYVRNSVPMYLRWMEYTSLINSGFAAMVINQTNYAKGTAGEFLIPFLEIDPSHFVGFIWRTFELAIFYRLLALMMLSVRVRFISKAL